MTYNPSKSYTVRENANGLPMIREKSLLSPLVADMVTPITRCPKVKLKGKWISLHPSSKMSKPAWFADQMKTIQAGNVFQSVEWGSTFMIVDSATVQVPLLPALQYKECINEYNCSKLLKYGESFPHSKMAEKNPRKMMMLSYDISRNYTKKYAMNKTKGQGMFLETHPFPHYVYAANPKTRLIMILGQQCKDNLYDLTAFHVPYGYVLYVAENTMHFDGLSSGTICISVDAQEDKTDSAFLRTSAGKYVQFKGVNPRHCHLNKHGEVVYVDKKSTKNVCKSARTGMLHYKTPKTQREAPIDCQKKTLFKAAKTCKEKGHRPKRR